VCGRTPETCLCFAEDELHEADRRLHPRHTAVTPSQLYTLESQIFTLQNISFSTVYRVSLQIMMDSEVNTKRRGRMVDIPVSYLGGPRFKS
jgi:hypothetical protein